MIAYQVNNKVFYNTYLAHHESFKSGQPVTFYCLEQQNDLLDWTREPEMDFEQLMDIHARALRDKYERLIFMWSGGTDSHTIYNVFKRNNIHIDEIIIKHSALVEPYPDSHVDWILKNHWDSTTKITAIDEYDTSLRQLVVANEDWIFDNSGDLLKYGLSALSKTTIEICERNHSGHHWGLVVGLEKPTVVFENGSWYTKQSDRVVRQAMGHDRVECFFLDPVINLKQSHMAKRVLKQLNPDSKNPSLTRWAAGAAGYHAWARVVGRHNELTIGISHVQKQINGKILNTTIGANLDLKQFDELNGETVLVSRLKQNDPTAINYVKGLYNLRSEKDFFAFLNKTCFESPDAIFKTREIWSKPYNLGN